MYDTNKNYVIILQIRKQIKPIDCTTFAFREYSCTSLMLTLTFTDDFLKIPDNGRFEP